MKSVFCIATSLLQANHIVDQLQTAGFHFGAISFLLADNSASLAFVCAKDIRQQRESMVETGPESAIRTGTSRGHGADCVVIHGTGPFLIAGPITGAMRDAPAGMLLGGVCGGLIRMGLPQIEAKRYEGKILYGDILLSVLATASVQCKRATNVFHRAKATDIRIAGKGINRDANPQASTWHQPIELQ